MCARAVGEYIYKFSAVDRRGKASGRANQRVLGTEKERAVVASNHSPTSHSHALHLHSTSFPPFSLHRITTDLYCAELAADVDEAGPDGVDVLNASGAVGKVIAGGGRVALRRVERKVDQLLDGAVEHRFKEGPHRPRRNQVESAFRCKERKELTADRQTGEGRKGVCACVCVCVLVQGKEAFGKQLAGEKQQCQRTARRAKGETTHSFIHSFIHPSNQANKNY